MTFPQPQLCTKGNMEILKMRRLPERETHFSNTILATANPNAELKANFVEIIDEKLCSCSNYKITTGFYNCVDKGETSTEC
ncbi:hypothetical protein [Albibacterium indicum]|uniref:hypothetical protein n=1 Tax=Albibacterium indicum TaxID=2292082 RepID=UPI0013003C47|nr:hypothetical protein [Pedobacter indicus]